MSDAFDRWLTSWSLFSMQGTWQPSHLSDVRGQLPKNHHDKNVTLGNGVMSNDDNETRLPIAVIKIGKRHRRDMGDPSELAQSIKDVSLLQPIVVRPDHTLIAGERRLRACEMAGLTEVPIRVVP